MKTARQLAGFARVLLRVGLALALVHGEPACSEAASANGEPLVLTISCGAVPPRPGQLFNLVGTITNTGSAAVTNINLIYTVLGTNAPVAPTVIPLLEPGQGTNFSGSYVVPPDACAVFNKVNASGTDVSGAPVAASTNTVCPVARMPALALGTQCPSTPPEFGMPLVVTGAVTNVGDIILTNVVIVSQLPIAMTVQVIPRLEPGMIVPFSFSLPTPSDSCAITNVVTAAGATPCGELVMSTVTLTCETAGTVLFPIVQIIQSIVPEGIRVDIFAYVTGVPPFNYEWNLDGIIFTNTMSDSPGVLTVFFDPTNEAIHGLRVNVTGRCRGALGNNFALFTTIGAITLSRGFPSITTGTNGSGAGPMKSTSCGTLDS